MPLPSHGQVWKTPVTGKVRRLLRYSADRTFKVQHEIAEFFSKPTEKQPGSGSCQSGLIDSFR
ncbi:hypothetical protein EPIB2_753 [Tritonibacter mobilis]|nr:hypothetical protein EPIB2_753 [Tritonibacter mobilis]